MPEETKPPIRICDACKLPHPGSWTCVQAHMENVKNLLGRIAESVGFCKGCTTPLFWIRHKNGKLAPYTHVGLNHFVDCPAAQTWREKATK